MTPEAQLYIDMARALHPEACVIQFVHDGRPCLFGWQRTGKGDVVEVEVRRLMAVRRVVAAAVLGQGDHK